jgi:hypothetical protein
MNALFRSFAPHRFTVDDMRTMARVGVLKEPESLELIDGVLIENSPPSFPPHRFTIDDVRAMARAGILDGVGKVELIDGVLIEMPADGPLHIDYSIAIGRWLYESLGAEYAIVPGSTLVLDK